MLCHPGPRGYLETHGHAHIKPYACMPHAPVRDKKQSRHQLHSRCALDYALRVEGQHAHACAWRVTSRATADDRYAPLDAQHLAWEASQYKVDELQVT